MDGIRHGYGVLNHANGERYEGQWFNGKIQGTGTLVSGNGDRYCGNFVNNVYEGLGIFTKVNGHTYNGEIKNGKCQGKGVVTYLTGEEYKGEWLFDFRHGKVSPFIIHYMIIICKCFYMMNISSTHIYNFLQGICKYPNGNIYRGTWYRGRFDGNGEMDNKLTGESYRGTWKLGDRSGYGIYTFSNGDVYKGNMQLCIYTIYYNY